MTEILIHAKDLEQKTLDQIESIKNHPALKGLIAIMPDSHVGVGCVIGFTGQFKGAVIPNLVGVDLGCGVLNYKLQAKEINLEGLDKYIRANIPIGFHERQRNDPWIKHLRYDESVENKFYKEKNFKRFKDANLQLGTLGGGNHFIEIEKEADEYYVTIHSGSRNFGLQVANHYQKQANILCEEMDIDVPKGQQYLANSYGGKEYMQVMRIAQEYASSNRLLMLQVILKFFNEEIIEENLIESVHNFIGRDNIIRKGAIRAYKGSRVVIPFNMADGVILGIGKSNKSYNFSAPHGSGRRAGRKEMFNRKTEALMEKFEGLMKGVYSTNNKERIFDESPMAYKDTNEVLDFIKETVEIKNWLHPIYNLKAED